MCVIYTRKRTNNSDYRYCVYLFLSNTISYVKISNFLFRTEINLVKANLK